MVERERDPPEGADGKIEIMPCEICGRRIKHKICADAQMKCWLCHTIDELQSARRAVNTTIGCERKHRLALANMRNRLDDEIKRLQKIKRSILKGWRER